MIDEVRQKVYRMQNPKKIRSTAPQRIAKSKAEKRCSAGEADGSTRLFFFRDILYTLYNKMKSSIAGITNNKLRRHSGGKKE